MVEKLFKTVKTEFQNCDKLQDRVKEILSTTDNSINDLDENNSNELWILLHDFIKETSSLEDCTQDVELLKCYNCILNLINHTINCSKDVVYIYEIQHLLKSILIFQTFYVKNFKPTFKFEIVKMCCKFCKYVINSMPQNMPSLDFDEMMTQNFIFTFNYIFSAINVTTKKYDMKTLSSLLREFCNIMSSLSSNQNVMKLIVFNLEKMMQNTLFLETEAGKLTIADTFSTSQQLFIRFHHIVKTLLPKANKLKAEAYGEMYFIAWINSKTSMREVIEQQGMFDIISNTFLLQRKGRTSQTYHNALILLQSMQIHRKHLMFSKIITKLYAPVLWRQLSSDYAVVRCNAIEILTRAYPLEKRGEGREVSSKFLIKQQNAFLDLLEDRCPQVRIAAIKGICTCMRYFWNSFEADQIIKYFSLFMPLIDESVVEVRRVIYHGFCQLLDEHKSHCYFKNPYMIAAMKPSLNDENERVRRAFIHFLSKIKKVDSQIENDDKINFAKIVNLEDIASALAQEDKVNGFLLVDLIFDNFIGEKVPDRHATLKRFQVFYKINPIAFRKLIFYSEKNLKFNDAYRLILSLLRTLNFTLTNAKERLNNTNKENNIPAKKRKTNNDSDDISNTSSSNTSSVSDDENNKQNEVIHICCILDCVNCLMNLHCNTFNSEQMKEIQDTCATCLIKLFKLYKEGDAYFCAMSLASVIPVSKLNSHVTVSSIALSTLKQLPYDMAHTEEEIDMRRVNCLIYTLCMWKRGYEILQFVNIWFDEAFRTLNLNETQYPESIIQEAKKVRFKTNIEECKPMTGILLINSILNNLQIQNTLVNSDVNKKNIFDLILYLQRVKPAIENRISSDNILNDLLSDELLIQLFLLNMRLHTIYHIHNENNKSHNIDVIMEYQISVLDWIINNLLVHEIHTKTESTLKFTVKLIDTVNYIIQHICLMGVVNNTFLDYYIKFCATILQNHLGPYVLMSINSTLLIVAKHYNYLKLTNNIVNNTSTLTNCICSIISVLSKSNFTEERFKSVIGKPVYFRSQLTLLFLEIHKITSVDFKQIFMTVIDTITTIIANQIREINEVDLNENITEIPFIANHLTMTILNNAQLREQFSSNAILLFSSNEYKTDCALLLSAISYVYTLSFQFNKTKWIDLEPVVKLLYKLLLDHDKTTTPLGNNCLINNTNTDPGVSILEVSDFTDGILNYKQKGRNALIASAKQLHITLSE